MAESNSLPETPGISENDPLDISELASLNEEYSADFIEQLQSKLEQTTGVKANKNVGMDTDDTELFEEVPSKRPILNQDIDDNFMKKYKAKLAKQQQNALNAPPPPPAPEPPPVEVPVQEELPPVVEPKSVEEVVESVKNEIPKTAETEEVSAAEVQTPPSDPVSEPAAAPVVESTPENIESITGGNIVEKPLDKAQAEYNQSLDYLDNNTKYSKYVIYIDPENKDFIDSLTVKERKNLINRIIREQDSVVVTKKNLNRMQTVITHIIIALLTIIISVPCIYWVFNVSLESTINNYRSSQKMFQTLYKEHGKIQSQRK